MKKLILIILLAPLLFWSCEENVSPKAPLPDDNVVNLIIRGGSSFQTATVTKIYDVEGFNPGDLKTDPSVAGAKIYLKYSGSNTEYLFRDTTDNNLINKRFGTPAKYYYLKNFQMLHGNEVEVKAVMPGGKIITSKTKIPEGVSFTFDGTTPFIPGPLIGRDTVNISVAWNNSPTELVKMGKVKLVYFYKELDGSKTRYEKEVPLGINVAGNDTVKNYVLSNFKNEFKFSRALLKKSLEEISLGNPAKGRYSIAPLEVEIYVMDEYLTRLYSAGLLYDYGFTVRNLPTQISNMSGGLGFFGSYSYSRISIRFEDQYLLNNFGYLREK